MYFIILIIALIWQPQGYSNNSNDTKVHFNIEMNGDKLDIARQEGLYDHFKLTTKLSTANMRVLDANGEVKKYSTPELSK